MKLTIIQLGLFFDEQKVCKISANIIVSIMIISNLLAKFEGLDNLVTQLIKNCNNLTPSNLIFAS